MSRLAAIVRQLAADPRSDGALLGAFLTDRDEAAFAELVRRHAPLVWGACRRGLPDRADVEDAFQATFLVLVRRANRLTASATVGPWLYRVAVWTAGNLRRKNARRLARRRELPDAVPDTHPVPEPSLDLDAALLALPERYRAALVLCCLEGLTHREAATRLGCAEGTASSLVSRGLAKLRARLAGRDQTAALALAAAVVVPNTVSAVAARTAAAVRVLSSAAPPAVAELTEGVLRMFWLPKATAAGLVSAAVLTLGLGIGLTGNSTGPIAAADTPAKPTDQPKPEPDPKIQELQQRIDLLRKQANAERRQANEMREMAALRLRETEKKVEDIEARLASAIKELETVKQSPNPSTVLKELDFLNKRSNTSIVIHVTGDKNPSVMLSEDRKDGGTLWEVTFHPTKPGDLTGLRTYLSRAALDKTVDPRITIIRGEKLAGSQFIKDLVKTAADAGFRSIRLEYAPQNPDRVKSPEPVRLSTGLQIVVPKGGSLAISQDAATVITIPVGEVARITLSEGKFLNLNSGRVVPPGGAEGDVISSSINAADVITIRGLKPSDGAYINPTDDQGRTHLIKVTVTEKKPGGR